MNILDNASPAEATFLPDFCSARATLPLVLLAELLAFLLATVRQSPVGFWVDLGQLSLFCEFMTLTSALTLCFIRRCVLGRSTRFVAAISYGALILVAAGLSELALFLDVALGFHPVFGWQNHLLIIGRIVFIAAVVDGLLLHYFYVLAQWRQGVRQKAESRLQALQARVRPHFLFNTLNTAAALVREQPKQAEQALEDLAQLFRASLAEKPALIRFSDEVALTRRYLELEQLRLGERLRASWNLSAVSDSALVPALLFQPLLENAVYHGIERKAGGGQVKVEAWQDKAKLFFRVTNPCVDARNTQSRHEVGLAAVQARLELAFGGRARLNVRKNSNEFIVILEFPYIEADDEFS